MSSSRISYTRKRRSDDECSSSDSDEEVPPLKKARVWNRESSMFPKYLLYIKDTLAAKLQTWFHWISELPIGTYSRENMLRNSIERRIPIVMEDDDDEEEIDVIEIPDDDEDGDDDLIIEEFTNIPEDSTERDSLQRNSLPVTTPNPLSSSTPFYKTRRTSRGRTLSSLSHQPVNGCNGSKTYPTRDKKNNSHQQIRYNRSIAAITNPSSDVEILLDTRQTGEESDDLEILSEMPSAKSPRRLTRQTVSPIVSKYKQQSQEYNGDSNSIVNGKAMPLEKQATLNKSFTAHEVIRLQEKAHYQLILDKMIGTSTYRPLVPKQDAKPAEIQIDLTEDDDEPVAGNHFKKEVLEKPVNEFLQKYYKPCQFKPCAAPKDDSDVQIFTEDEDVQVIETKLPEYKPKSRRKPDIMSADWINELKEAINIETKHRLQIVAAQEQKLERYRKRRDAKITEEKLLRGQTVSSKQAEKDEFPELTSEMEDRVDWALGPGSPVEELSAVKDWRCTRSDMSTLAGLNWLNDTIINFYLALITERGKNNPDYPPVFAFNSFFYSSLKSRGPKAVMRWTRRLEDNKSLFQFDILFVPLHLGMHWALCVVDNRLKKIKYYDSMQGTDDACLTTLQSYLVFEKQDKLGITMDPNEYSLEIVKDIPQQMNGSDCGMFTLKYAEYISRDVPITFSQKHMQYFRRRMVIEILERRLF